MCADIFIGVDGGGTKCKARVEDAAGNLLGEGRGGPAKISISVDEAWRSILTAVNQALLQSGISLRDSNYKFHAGFGLSGTEVTKASADFVSRPYPFTNISLHSDAYAACIGAHAGEPGAIIIIGTGVVGMRITPEEEVRVSGWGFPHSDEGGGAWLGLEAVRMLMHAYDGRKPFSPLLRAILAKFDNDFFKLVGWANKACSTQFAEIAPLVVQHVDLQDPYALQLIKLAAEKIDEVAATMEGDAQYYKEGVPYSLFGGIVPFVTPWLSDDLKQRLVERKHDATWGAIAMVKRVMEAAA